MTKNIIPITIPNNDLFTPDVSSLLFECISPKIPNNNAKGDSMIVIDNIPNIIARNAYPDE